MIKLGMNGKLYRNTGTYAVPTWAEITNVKDVTLTLETGEADVTTRANAGWRASRSTLKTASIEFEMVWDTEDAGFAAIQAAFFDNTTIEVAVMDGDIEVADTEGLRATVSVATFSRSEPLEEAMKASVTLKPTYADHAPEWITSSGTAIRLSFTKALAAGAGTIDLTAIPYGDGAYDGTGKTVVGVQITNTGANALTVSKAVSNGYELFASPDPIIVPAGGSVNIGGDGGGAIGGSAKNLTLNGTGAQESVWELLLE